MKVNKSHLINQTQYKSEVINKYKYIPSKWETIKSNTAGFIFGKSWLL